jgi:hypothetical protein
MHHVEDTWPMLMNGCPKCIQSIHQQRLGITGMRCALSQTIAIEVVFRSSSNLIESQRHTARARARQRTAAAEQDTAASPQLPHERDESPDAAPVEPQRRMRAAASDVRRGLVDTESRQEALAVFNRTGKKGKNKRPSRARSR